MFETPVDTWYLWLGVATASVVAFGLAVSFPTTPAPDATRIAATVDSVVTSPHEATGEHPITADEIRLGSHRISLRSDGRRSHASFTYGPVTPVPDGTPLERVLTGTPPEVVFENRSAFRTATERARNRSRDWRDTDERLLARRVTWGEIDVTLVGA